MLLLDVHSAGGSNECQEPEKRGPNDSGNSTAVCGVRIINGTMLNKEVNEKMKETFSDVHLTATHTHKYRRQECVNDAIRQKRGNGVKTGVKAEKESGDKQLLFVGWVCYVCA